MKKEKESLYVEETGWPRGLQNHREIEGGVRNKSAVAKNLERQSIFKQERFIVISRTLAPSEKESFESSFVYPREVKKGEKREREAKVGGRHF